MTDVWLPPCVYHNITKMWHTLRGTTCKLYTYWATGNKLYNLRHDFMVKFTLGNFSVGRCGGKSYGCYTCDASGLDLIWTFCCPNCLPVEAWFFSSWNKVDSFAFVRASKAMSDINLMISDCYYCSSLPDVA